MAVEVWLLTGWRGVGKTTFCQHLVDRASERAWQVSGLLSPAEFSGQIKQNIWAVDLRGGEKCLLASAARQTPQDYQFVDWYFNRQAFSWGNQVLRESLPTRLLIIDELGPLEFNFSQGWTAAFDVLRQPAFSVALVVVRPELIESASALWNPSRIIELKNRADSPGQLRAAVQSLEDLLGQ